MSLALCLKQAVKEVSKEDAELVRAAYADHLANGLSGTDAAKSAVQAVLDMARAERKQIVAQIEKAGGVVPQTETPAPPAPAPTPVAEPPQPVPQPSGEAEPPKSEEQPKPVAEPESTGGAGEPVAETGGETAETGPAPPNGGTTGGPFAKPEAKPKTGATAPEPPKNDIQDSGEKIGGARKDQFRGGLTENDLQGLSDAERAKLIKKQTVFPRLDYAALVADGVDPTAAYLVKTIYDRIPNEPALSSYDHSKSSIAEAEQQYVKVLRALRSLISAVRTVEDVRGLSGKLNYAIRGDESRWSSDDYGAITQSRGRRRYEHPANASAADHRKAEREIKAGWPNQESWQRLIDLREDTHFDEATRKYTDQKLWSAIWKTRRDGKWIIARDLATREEAAAAAKAAYESIGDEDDKGKEPKRPPVAEIARTGSDYRGGRDIASTDTLKADFGYRGVEWGDWVTQGERQPLLNYAYDALHDFARALGLPQQALSLDGSNGLAIGSRGHGGKVAAHYEPAYLVTNLTKTNGAGSLVHEWGHAFDHYIGELFADKPYGREAHSLSGWYSRDKSPDGTHARLQRWPARLRSAAAALLDTLHYSPMTEPEIRAWRKAKLATAREQIAPREERVKKARAALQLPDGKARQHRATLAEAEQQIEAWTRWAQRELRKGPSKAENKTSFFKNAIALSGNAGEDGYWARPTEMFARSLEAYVFDKLQAAGHASPYLVQGVEGDRFKKADGYKGNPYPDGAERVRINAAYDTLFEALYAGAGKLGAFSQIKARRGAPPKAAETSTYTIPDISSVEKIDQLLAEMEAMDKATGAVADGDVKPAAEQPSVLADHYANFFRGGGKFENILAARRLAKDKGFGDDPKLIEEAIELGVVKVAREIANLPARDAFDKLVDLYGRQPNLSTRTSTSVRDQAYSTPIPLAYVAARLGGVTPGTSVYEPTAGNGALLITANPQHALVNEINPQRRENLQQQGFVVTDRDATEALPEGFKPDVILMNPPFGAVRDESGTSKTYFLSDIVPGYSTSNVDQAIALRSLQALPDYGSAVLLLAGPHKMLEDNLAGRTQDYRGDSKRQFYKALYDRYNVTDHFTVSGDLYSRQGAGWPVDVIVIEGRGKSSKALPAVEAPPVLKTWDEVGGKLDGRDDRSDVGRPDAGTSQGDAGAGAGGRHGGRGPAPVGGGRGGATQPGGPGEIQPGPVSPGPVPGTDRTGGGAEPRPAGDDLTAGTGAGAAPGPRGPGLTPDEIAAGIDKALDDVFGPEEKTASSPPAPRPGGAEPRAPRAEPGESEPRSQGQKGLDALADLFGAKRKDEGPTAAMAIPAGPPPKPEPPRLDEGLYAQTKAAFLDVATMFRDLWRDIFALGRRIMQHLKDVEKWTREAFERVKPYLQRFLQEVQDGTIRLKPEAAPPDGAPAARLPRDIPTEHQSPYQTHSGEENSAGALAPSNLVKPMSDSLAALKAEVGDLNGYVAKEIGYLRNATTPHPHFIDDKGEVQVPFFSEQVDGIALAIYNIGKPAAEIIGDMTGIGKGRQIAGVLRWAHKQGHVPVFFTEKPDLYADMYRDLTDVGVREYLGREPRILMTDAGKMISLDPDRNIILKSQDLAQHTALLRSLNADNIRKKYDFVFTTYNQIQTVAEQAPERRDFLLRLAPRGIFTFDESHNGGAADNLRGPKTDEHGHPLPPNRAEFTRLLVDAAHGALYASATYAKRPESMDLYRKTDMRLAVDNPEQLPVLIARGGVPLQQVVAHMLAQSGQYVRRERSYHGVDYNVEPVDVAPAHYRGISQGLSSVQEFSLLMPDIVDHFNSDPDNITLNNVVVKGNATGQAGADSINFTAIMHNIVDQMLLAMKAEPAALAAIAAIKRGEKPVVTVANTMGSFLGEYIENNPVMEANGIERPLAPGDPFEADFRGILDRYLDRVRTVTIKTGPGKKDREKHYLTDQELRKYGGEHAVETFQHARDTITGLDLAALPVSPIDYIRNRLAEAGFKSAEITGRDYTVDYGHNNGPVLSKRAAEERGIKGKQATIRAFNRASGADGGLDAVVINRSGATGISLHASQKFKDQRQRHMIIAQAESDINYHMQILGRVHRTGQVIVPIYTHLTARVPAEIRPTAVLQKKMASLNANTTASRRSALTAKDVPDFINQYGDQIAAQWAKDNPGLNAMLGSPVYINDKGKATVGDAMKKLTGRLPMFEPDLQEQIYEELTTSYGDLIDQLNAEGKNALEAKNINLKAITERVAEVQGPKDDSGSVFSGPVNIEQVTVARPSKPHTPKEVVRQALNEIAPDPHSELESLSVKELGAIIREMEQVPHGRGGWGEIVSDALRARNLDGLTAFKPYRDERVQADPDAAKDLDADRDRWMDLSNLLTPGRRVSLNTADEILTGIVLKVERKGNANNPLALSAWRVLFALASGETREIKFPFSRLYPKDKAPADDEGAIEVTNMNFERPEATLERFAHLQAEVREQRYIASGNLLAGFDWLSGKGQIVNYTTSTGDIRQGILTPRKFDLGAHATARGRVLENPTEIVSFLAQNPLTPIHSRDNLLTITSSRDGRYYIAAAPSRRSGGIYYTATSVTEHTGEFTQRKVNVAGHRTPQNRMVAAIHAGSAAEGRLTGAVKAMQALGAQFAIPGNVDWRDVPPPPAAPAPDAGPTAAMARPVPGLYSQVARAVESAPLKSARADQWLGYLKNRPGVKGGELSFLQLPEWLGSQTGAISKQAVADYVRANQLQVHEVEKGQSPQRFNDPELAKAWLREVHNEDPEERYGYRDENDYVSAANQLSETLEESKLVEALEKQADAGHIGANTVQQRASLIARGDAEAIGEAEGLGVDDAVLAPFRDRGGGPTRFGQLVLPGGQNYKEIVFTLPWKATPAAGTRFDAAKGGHIAVDAQGRDLTPGAWDTPGEATRMSQSVTAQSVRGNAFVTNHWPDDPNSIAHVRFDERTTSADGTSYTPPLRTLHISEVQSDRHQRGRREGYQGKPLAASELKNWAIEKIDTPGRYGDQWYSWHADLPDGTRIPILSMRNSADSFADHPMMATEAQAKAVLDREGGYQPSAKGVPDAPLKTTWPDFVMKRMIQFASENGFDRITWDTGETNADRYDLSKHIGAIGYQKRGEDRYNITAWRTINGDLSTVWNNQSASLQLIEDHLGKELAERISKGDGRKEGSHTYLEGLNLKVGGEGQLGFYDDILPKTVNKLVKKYGASVGQATLQTGNEKYFTVVSGGFQRGHFATRQEAIDFAHRNGGNAEIRQLSGDDIVAKPVHSLDLTPALKEAALGEGFPVFHGLPQPQGEVARAAVEPAAPSYTAAAKRAALEQHVTAMLDHMTGGRFSRGLATVTTHDTIDVADKQGYGDIKIADNVGGTYNPVPDIIRIALADPDFPNPFMQTAHEGTHMALDHFATDQELALLRDPREQARMLDFLAQKMGIAPERLASMSNYEKEAFAGQYYIHDRASGGSGAGLHIGIRRLFEKVLEFFRRLGSFLRGKGFAKWEDVFEKIYSGEMSKRKSVREGEAYPGEKSRLARDILDEQAAAEKASAVPEGPAAAMAIPRGAAAAPPAAGPTSSYRERLDRFLHAPLMTRFIEGTQDLSIRVAHLETDVRARMEGVLPDSRAFYEMKRLYPGKRDNRVKNFNAAHLKPLFQQMKADAITVPDLGEYLYARHAIERNEKLGPLYEPDHQFYRAMADDNVVGASGMAAAEARAIRERIENGPQAAAYAALVGRVEAIRDSILEGSVRDHLLSQETVDRWREQYKDYVPLSGDEEAADNERHFGPGAKASVRGAEVKQAFGRRSKAANPLVNLLEQNYRAIERGERNRYLRALGRSLAGLSRDDRAEMGIKIDRANLKKIIDARTGMVREVNDYAARFSPNAVQFKIRGVPHYILFEERGQPGNRALADAINRMSPDQLEWFQGLLNFENKIKAMWTHYSPDFLVRHFLFRYPIEGLLNNFEQGGGIEGAIDFLKKGYPFLGEASRAIFARERGEPAGRLGELWDEMKAQGGAMSFRNMRDMDMLNESLEQGLRSLAKRHFINVRDKAQAAREMMDHVTNTLDNALRLAAYAQARERGLSPQKAAMAAREATVDFQLKGRFANHIGLWFPFGNVAIQTAARMEKAVYRSHIMRKVFLGTIASGFALAMYNYLVGGTDTDGVPFFEKIAPWERRLNLIILNPFDRDAKGRPQPIKIPMPYNWAFPLAIGYGFGNITFGKMDKGTTMGFILHSALEALTPMGSMENKTDLLSPELLRPLAHVATNRDAFNRPIHRDDTYQKQPNAYSGRPDFQGRIRTGQGWKSIAESINDLSGGSRTKSGALDFYPEDYREILDYVVGTQKRLIQNTIETGKGVANQITGQGPGPKPTEIPMSRVFYGTDYEASDRAAAYERSQKDKHQYRR